MTHRALLLLLITCLAGCAGRGVDPVATIEAFRAARDAGDLEVARAYLSDDPRVWYGSREGSGSPWTLGGGRWQAWDEHFNSSSTPGPWELDGGSVSRVSMEINDYYRLTEKGPSPVRLTWFLDDDGRIEGYLVSSVPRDTPSTSRYDEFEAWAREHDPDELDDLVPGGDIDPTGDRAPRFRRLLERWRADAGLPPIE